MNCHVVTSESKGKDSTLYRTTLINKSDYNIAISRFQLVDIYYGISQICDSGVYFSSDLDMDILQFDYAAYMIVLSKNQQYSFNKSMLNILENLLYYVLLL